MKYIQKEIESVTIQYETAVKVNSHALIIGKNNEKKYILSKYDPVKEAKRIISEYDANKETLWIVLGFCLGYVVEQIIQRVGKKVKILVIEPNTTILEKQLDMTKDSKWDQYVNLKIFSGMNFPKLKENYLANGGFASYSNTNVIFTQEYQEYYVRYYTEVMRIIAEAKAELMVNQNTVEAMNTIILSNIVRNRKYICKGYDIAYHRDKYENIPALIVSAGPSLEKNIHLIKEFKGIIFAVGRSLTSILNQGVKPDFVATVDPQKITYDTFMGNSNTDISLIASPSANTQILEESQGEIYFADNDVDTIKAVIGIDVPYFPIGGSVATLCLSVAEYMGCSPIVFVGQDLAYTGMKAHASDCNISEENTISEKNPRLRLVKEYYGGEVYSDYAFIGYRRWIESFITKRNKPIYINATEGGAYMEGAMHQPLSQVIEEYQHISKPQILHMQNQVKKTDIDENIYSTIEELKKLNSYGTQGERLGKELLNEYVLHKGLRQNKVDKILKKMDKLDRNITELDKKHLTNSLFTEVYNRYLMLEQYQTPLKESKIDEGIRVSTFNQEVYGALRNKSAEWGKVIKKAMEESNGTEARSIANSR